ncbi:hypothetical protein ACFQLX_22170 [Streptomyces polyrhachis]|uniref:Uncharacterized protein n=1 Tax=Streptomyces polyrhachis TaxID=1282885 RepID=A0ABW2GPJ5_9ACTN
MPDGGAIEPPPADRTLSPYTGWTRAHGEAAAGRLLDALAPYASPGFAQYRPPGRASASGAESDGLASTLAGLYGWDEAAAVVRWTGANAFGRHCATPYIVRTAHPGGTTVHAVLVGLGRAARELPEG